MYGRSEIRLVMQRNDWNFVMERHTESDADTGVINSVKATPTNVQAAEGKPRLMHVGKKRVQRDAVKEVAVADRGQEQLAAKLRASFEDSSVEDGTGHHAELIIANALVQAGDRRALHWFKNFCTDASQPGFASSVLRCLARVDSIGTESWRAALVRDGLAADSVEMRDAAIQAAESWGDSNLIAILIAHSDPEPWLQRYVLDVIDDLSG